MALSILPVSGADIVRRIPDLAALRIGVFREWPYLYEGDFAHEAEYLRVYSESPSALVVLALDGERVVGASTAVALTSEPEKMQDALRAGGFDPAKILYAGESLLYPEYRGHGVGLRFFEEREAHARRLGFTHVAFCRVIRSKDDPRRPVDAVDLDGYWRRRGYTLRSDIRTSFSWKEVGGTVPVENAMEFWIKALR
jgi:GNAT superfamily N-acetyltransferase